MLTAEPGTVTMLESAAAEGAGTLHCGLIIRTS
jgi:hypothetical protein